MFKKVVLFTILVFVFSISISAQKSVDAAISKCFQERYHDLSNSDVEEMAIFNGFENKLLNAGILLDNSQESYAMLMANLLNDDIEIPITYWNMANPDLAILSMPSNLATSMLCFDDAFEANANLLTNESSVIAMAPFVKSILDEYNLGNKSNNVQLVRAVNSEDFSKMIYKAPILVLLHNIASYKEEMNQLASNY